jgi:acetyl esterase/lipase
MDLPRVPVNRKILLPRPKTSQYTRSIPAYLFFQPTGRQLSETTDLILDFPGGGFVAQSPEHHEDRLCIWAIKMGKPVLSIDYGKAPEC